MLEICFYLLTLVLLGLDWFAIQYVKKKVAERSFNPNSLFIAVVVWLVYGFVISLTGILQTYDLPPRLPLLIVVPALLVVVYFHVSNKYRPILDVIPKSWAVYFQSFRILVELLIYGVYLKGYGPIEATFLGYNYELYFGISAIVIGLLTFQLKVIPRPIVIAWNFIGLCMLAIIVGIFITSFYFPQVWGNTEPMVKLEFTNYPYLMIASLYMPSAVCMHIFSIRQWLSKSE